ncbi:MAG TPA: carbohydrate ABC transporter permease [Acidimicrobiales bacterium]|nr:carbohydrate ABC transporter permease [Acidimicrobiales bacterium]
MTVAAPASSSTEAVAEDRASLQAHGDVWLPKRIWRQLPMAAKYAIVLVLALIYVVPMLVLVNTAFKTPNGFISNPTGLTKTVSLANFISAWNEGDFAAYIGNSVLYTFVVAGLGTLLSLLIAYPVARRYVPVASWLLGLFVVALFLPNSIPTQFELLLHIHLYNSRIGYMLVLLAGLGVGPLLITGYIRSIPYELDQAAAADGCGYFRYLFMFIAPIARPVLMTSFLLQAIYVWNEIILATIYLPSNNKLPVSAGLFAFYGQYTDQWSLIAAATLIICLPLIAVFLVLQRYFVAGALSGAFK